MQFLKNKNLNDIIILSQIFATQKVFKKQEYTF
ncbi:MAG: hypothetical protein CM15mP44_7500 [Candidatus Neomarinimicrobiota bacterium]|nr:MAG: hypothetical protein CM15mP44_7500 [Candidatus Neomarinimicrobiota bacterium]